MLTTIGRIRIFLGVYEKGEEKQRVGGRGEGRERGGGEEKGNR